MPLLYSLFFLKNYIYILDVFIFSDIILVERRMTIMYNNSYNLIKYLYDANSEYKRINNAIKVYYRYMTPQQMINEECKDEMMKKILFG